jgi:hypothetical protein
MYFVPLVDEFLKANSTAPRSLGGPTRTSGPSQPLNLHITHEKKTGGFQAGKWSNKGSIFWFCKLMAKQSGERHATHLKYPFRPLNSSIIVIDRRDS